LSCIWTGIRQLEAGVPETAEAVTPDVVEFTVLSCTLRKAVVKIWTFTWLTGSAKEAATVTGSPVEGLGKTTGVVLGWGVEVMVDVSLAVGVKVAADVEVGVMVGVEEGKGVTVRVGVLVGVEVAVAVGWVTVTVAPKTGMPLNKTGWPLVALIPETLKL